MRLLICTQAVDQNDPILGFFHQWIEEFAKRTEKVTVICLKEGKHNLPTNVRVLSLGKEKGGSRITYLFRFYTYLFRERSEYEAVFVHMNQEYILLGGLFWIYARKKIAMWRNHYKGSIMTDIAAALCDQVFCTSQYSYTAKYKKTKLMPVGIDTKHFIQQVPSRYQPRSILFFARIAPSKRVDLLIDALKSLYKTSNFRVDIIGSPLARDAHYYEKLQKEVSSSSLSERISFSPGISKEQAPDLYQMHEFFVNTSPSGMLDKTIFEAAACGSIILVSNKDLKGQIPEECSFEEGSVDDLAEKLKVLLALSEQRKEEIRTALREIVGRNSLERLADTLVEVMERPIH